MILHDDIRVGTDSYGSFSFQERYLCGRASLLSEFMACHIEQLLTRNTPFGSKVVQSFPHRTQFSAGRIAQFQ